MEERKFDPYQFIGFILIALILTWMLYRNGPQETQDNAPVETNQTTNPQTPQPVLSDSVQQQKNVQAFGDFGGFFQAKKIEPVLLENKNLAFEFDTKGAIVTSLRLKEFNNYQDVPLFLVNDKNTQFNLLLKASNGMELNTSEMYFQPTIISNEENQEVVFESKTASNQMIRFVYTLPEDGYQIKLEISTSNFAPSLSRSDTPKLTWSTTAFRNSRSIEYENRYTEYTYGYDEDRVDYLSLSGDDEEQMSNIRWISYRQHFFSAILVPNEPLDEVQMYSENLADEEKLEERFTKRFSSTFPVERQNGELDAAFNFYYGPTDYKTLELLPGDLEASIPLGWGIFGWINRWVFLPLFGFLSTIFPYGIAIIVLTLIVRLAMSPVTYKSYVSQIKMKLLRPEVDAINEKHKDNAVKKQQETMSLYSKAGASPLAGCVPALIQLPVFYALFTFFPVAFVLREKSFLWADDLSSYDSVLELPFNVPFYGDHVSLFPILASIAIFFYTRMTTGQQPMPQQPGMPNMKVIMYLMPVMMLFFFNNYASGLSLYYFVSNLLTIFLMLIIKNYIIDDKKIHAKLEENKKKPKKVGGFSARLQKAMEEAEKQKKAGRRRG